MKLFIWDFHGTLEQGNEFAVEEISNLALESLGFSERLSTDDCLRLYGKKWYEYFEDVLPKETHEQHIALQEESIRIQRENPEIIERHIKASEHVHEVLNTISQSGHDQILISNTLQNYLIFFLKSVNIEKYFPKGKAIGINTHSKNPLDSKTEALKRFLIGKDYETIISIGDSIEDVHLALDFGGIAYNYAHPGNKFRYNKANYNINDLREVLKEL